MSATTPRPKLRSVKGGKASIGMTTIKTRAVGRPSKATPTALDKIVEALKLGATHKLAAQCAGMSERTFYQHQADNPQFAQAIEAAEAAGAMQHLATITALTQSGDPAVMLKASTWLLERRYPDDYSRKDVKEKRATGETIVRVIIDNAWRGEVQQPDMPLIPESAVVDAIPAHVPDAASEASIGVTFEGD